MTLMMIEANLVIIGATVQWTNQNVVKYPTL